jgi:heme oxygenase
MYSSNVQGLGQLTAFQQLLQTGTALYQKYQSIKDIKKQKKEAEEYRKALEEARKAEAELRAMQAVAPKIPISKVQVPFVGAVDTTTLIIIGILGIAGIVLLRRK